MEFHVYHHTASDPQAAQSLCLLQTLIVKVETIMTTLADIEAALAKDEAAEAKIIALLNTQAASLKDLAKQLADALAGGDQAAMQTIVDKMNTDADAMDAAAASVTPPVTPPAPAPVPTPDPAPPVTPPTAATGTASGSAT